ncbi:SRPBCC family protein [Nonomuraea rhodomycinica]|uniref:SRPBCC domain-containing protein n=1 Tax=Nonomuraea rhodomycinica TaxID=1712872 RepID=A0A7Y6IJC8_9ACTN|nr:SRPBCC domain-containing protein [Nonomuraea rhodomycinica]NUW39223.1 SRPBCC domain-containing protein [Nonomuraea rhodomycinica]
MSDPTPPPGATDVDDDLRSIHLDQFLAHPPAKVWRAITDPGLMARWLMPNDFKPVVGHRFTYTTKPMEAVGFDGIVRCEVLEVVRERLLRISWRGGRNADWTVTWRLEPEGTGTRLFLDHEGFDPDDATQQLSRRIMGSGWRSGHFRAIAAILDELPA